MAKKKRKNTPPLVSEKKVAQKNKKEFHLASWIKYILVFLFLASAVSYIYQEPVYQKKVLSLADIKGQGVPFKHYRSEFEKKYDEPALWIPYIFSGMPFHASGSYRIRYTVESFYRYFPGFYKRFVHETFGFSIVLGGIFMFILMRSFGLGILSSLTATVAFIFTTKVIGTPHTNRITTFMHIPLIFYAVKEIWKKPRWWLVLVLGGALGSQIGSYHPQISHLTGIFILLFLIFVTYRDYKANKDFKPIVIKGSYLLAGLVLALLMAAIVIIPMSEYMPYSIRGAKTAVSTGTGGGLSSSYATMWSLGWSEILTFFIPGFSGFGYETYWGTMPFTSFPNYLGISVMILAILYAIVAKRDSLRWFWIGSFVVVLLIALGGNLPPVSYLMLHFFPYFNKFREPSMITIINSLIAAIMAGLFIQYLKDLEDDDIDILITWIKRMAIFFAAVLVVFVIFSGALKSFFFDIYHNADNAMGRYTQYRFEQLTPLYELRFKMLNSDIIRISLIALAVLGSVWAYVNKKLSYQFLSALILLFIVVDLFIPDRQSVKKQYTETQKPQTYYQAGNPVADWLKAHESFENYRILPVDDFGSNQYVYYDIPSVGGYHAVKMANYQAYLDKVTFNNRTLINMLSTKYIISKRQFSFPGTVFEANVQGNNIYRNLQAMPYIRFVDRIISENDKDKIDAAIKEERFNLRTTAYVTSSEKIQNRTFDVDSSRSVKIEEKHPQLIHFSTNNRFDDYCIISEMHYPPGWRAYIDDKPAEIFLTNAGLMGLFIPAGVHDIRIRYEQPSFFISKTISMITFWGIILILLGYALFQTYDEWKKRKHAIE